MSSHAYVKVEPRLTFTFTRSYSYSVSILFTHEKPIQVYERIGAQNFATVEIHL